MKIEKITELDRVKSLTKHKSYDILPGRATGLADCLLVTNIKNAVKDPNRVNIYIDHKYSFSLDVSQLVDHPLKIGQQLTDAELAEYKKLSDFGKLYVRTLEYSFSRPHSEKEIRNYLKKKTTPTNVRVRNSKTGEYETKPKKVYSSDLVPAVLDRLKQKGHIDDVRFSTYLVENYHHGKGASKRRLEQELRKKGISDQIIDQVLSESTRSESEELAKIIAKKRQKYADDPQKLIQYLACQGFDYESCRTQVLEMDSQN